MHRGANMRRANILVLFPSGYAVRGPALLQKIFPIRRCENSVYRNRSRPVCSIRLVAARGRAWPGWSAKKYAQQVEYVRLFLAGKDDRC